MRPDHRFVAHIDILGMRAMVRRDPEMAWRVLSGLADVRDHVNALQISHIEAARQEMLAQRVFSIMFSDTIVLFTKAESDADLQAVLIAVCEILHKAMCAFVPVRIGIAGGWFFFNIEQSLYSGPALIDAYELGEAAQWLGIVTTEEVYKQATAAGVQTEKHNIVVPSEIPTKQGLVPGFAVNWVAAFRHDFKVKPPISTNLFYSQFEHAFGPLAELPERERLKYENTTQFINARLAEA